MKSIFKSPVWILLMIIWAIMFCALILLSIQFGPITLVRGLCMDGSMRATVMSIDTVQVRNDEDDGPGYHTEYRQRYEYEVNGITYAGVTSSSKTKPRKNGTVPIRYSTDNPENHMTVASFYTSAILTLFDLAVFGFISRVFIGKPRPKHDRKIL